MFPHVEKVGMPCPVSLSPSPNPSRPLFPLTPVVTSTNRWYRNAAVATRLSALLVLLSVFCVLLTDEELSSSNSSLLATWLSLCWLSLSFNVL